MTDTLRHSVEFYPNPDIAEVHIRHRLGDVHEFKAGHATPWPYDERLSAEDVELYREISAVAGVEHIHARGYRLTVEKGRAFAWHEILPSVVEVLTKRFGAEAEPGEATAGPPPPEPSNQWTQTSLGNGWMVYSRATRCDSTTAEMAGAILDARQVATPDARTEGGDVPKEAAGEAKPVNFREFT